MLDKDFSVPSKDLSKELNWITFKERIDYKKAILMYKTLNNLCPEYLGSNFSSMHYNTDRELRSIESGKLQVPKPRIEFFRKSISYSGTVIWNGIPKEIRDSKSLACFKQSYLQWKYSGDSDE